MAADLALALAGLPPEKDRELIREAARIHEVGKLYVPLEVLELRPAELNARQRSELRTAPEHGRAVAAGAGVPERACAWILHARERWDGSGPGGLEGREIPLGSRIIAVVREYLDAPLAPDAAGRDPREVAIERLGDLAGTMLDPEIADRAAGLASRSG